MSEHFVGYQTRHFLNQIDPIDPRIAARLVAIRVNVLARKQETTNPSLLITSVASVLDYSRALAAKLWLVFLLIIFAALSASSWRQSHFTGELEKIDTALLTGDLPINAYTDPGFDAWLKRPSR